MYFEKISKSDIARPKVKDFKKMVPPESLSQYQ
jgi:hypothetical protein